MTDQERQALIARIEQDTKRVKTLTREEAKQRLVESGIYTDDGRLSPRYGGRAAARV